MSILKELRRPDAVQAMAQEERTRLQDILQTANKRLNVLLRQTNLALWDFAVGEDGLAGLHDGTPFEMSDEYRKMLGYSSEADLPNLLGSFNSTIHPEDKLHVDDAFGAFLSDPTGRTAYDVEYRAEKKTGEYMRLREAASIERAADGTIARIYGFVQDISRRPTKDELDALIQNFEANVDILKETGNQNHTAIGSVVVNAMQNLEDTNGSISNAKDIEKILEQIESVAGQINLVALNANIESNRIGDDGAPFAVIASEIARLATQTQKLALEGRPALESFEGDVTKISQNAQGLLDVIVGGKQVADETAAALGDLSKNYLTFTDLVKDLIEGRKVNNVAVIEVPDSYIRPEVQKLMQKGEGETSVMLEKALDDIQDLDGQIRSTYKRLHQILRQTGLALWNAPVDMDNRQGDDAPFHASGELRKMLGYTDEKDFPDVLGSFNKSVHPDDRERVSKAIDEFLLDKSGRTPFDVELLMKKKTGGYIPVRMVAMAERLAGGAVQVYGFTEDMSGRLTMDELKKFIENLEMNIAVMQGNSLKTGVAVQSVNELATDSGDAADRAIKSSKNVKKMLDKLQDIAKTCQMMALYASIEAARVDANFGSIAGDVRELTGKIQRLANNAEPMLETLQKNVISLKEGTVRTLDLVEIGKNLVKEAVAASTALNGECRVLTDIVKASTSNNLETSNLTFAVAKKMPAFAAAGR